MNLNFIQRFIFSIFAIPIVLFLISLGKEYFFFILFIILLIGLYEIVKLTKITYKIIIFLILFLFLYSCVSIVNYNNGMIYIFLLLIISWLSDIGGYAFGKIIGGKKISFISHNKTYSGFIGSILFSQVSLIYIFYYQINISDSIVLNSLLLVFFSLIVISGDLIFSYFKRKNDIKDYSNIIPGHGGLFDRIDGLIILTIFFNIILKIK